MQIQSANFDVFLKDKKNRYNFLTYQKLKPFKLHF